MRCLKLLPALGLVLVACTDAPAPTEPEPPLFSTTSGLGYKAIELGTLGGIWAEAVAINEAGQVVGNSETVGGDRHAFLWDGVMHDLGTLDGTESRAFAINDAGQVVGSSLTAAGEMHAFLWDGVMQDLGTLGGTESGAFDINNAGQVVGTRVTASGEYFAFLWDGAMQDICPGGARNPFNDVIINEAGQVLGCGGLWDHGELYAIAGWPYDMNNAGQVVGTADGGWFLWDGEMHDLGWSKEALGINDAGQVVGHSATASVPQGRAALWNGGDLQFLGPPDVGWSAGRDINEAGQVAIWSVEGQWETHVYLWDEGVTHHLGQGWPNDLNNAGQVVGDSGWSAMLWRVLTPVEHLESCAALVSELEAQDVLNKGQAHSLVNKINVGTAMLNDGKNTPAINMLEAFQNEASGYVNGGNITPEQGEELVSCVQVVIDDASGS